MQVVDKIEEAVLFVRTLLSYNIEAFVHNILSSFLISFAVRPTL